MTLAGPGDSSKTRLAIEAATHARTAFSDGVVCVDLLSMREPALVLPAIARTVAAPDLPTRSCASISPLALHGKAMLLVLDNLEQVVEAGPELAAFAPACPKLHALITCRIALRLTSEHPSAMRLLTTSEPATASGD